MSKFSKLILFVGTALLFSLSAPAAVTPVSIGLVPPLQFPPSDFTITGLRTSLLWGNHRDVYGIDLGLLGNITEGNFVGLGVSGIFNLTRGTTTVIGAQLAGITNVNTKATSIHGVQLALGLNSNQAATTITGIQAALLANLSPFTNIYGAQLGLYNTAQEVYGFQIGLVNMASSLHGIQIGLLNFNAKGLFKVSPIINVGF